MFAGRFCGTAFTRGALAGSRSKPSTAAIKAVSRSFPGFAIATRFVGAVRLLSMLVFLIAALKVLSDGAAYRSTAVSICRPDKVRLCRHPATLPNGRVLGHPPLPLLPVGCHRRLLMRAAGRFFTNCLTFESRLLTSITAVRNRPCNQPGFTQQPPALPGNPPLQNRFVARTSAFAMVRRRFGSTQPRFARQHASDGIKQRLTGLFLVCRIGKVL